MTPDTRGAIVLIAPFALLGLWVVAYALIGIVAAKWDRHHERRPHIPQQRDGGHDRVGAA